MSLHLITLCMGLIIAFGLQQIVELFQRRRGQRPPTLTFHSCRAPHS